MELLSIFNSTLILFVCLALSTPSSAPKLAALIQMLADIVTKFQYGTRLSSELENYMTSVNRCLEYTRLPSEEPLPPPPSPPDGWPVSPRITFTDIAMRYRPDLPPALHHFSLRLTSSSKVGVVGRTGAGKSSILQTLLRLHPSH